MRKGFLVLVGNREAKNILQEHLRQDYWIWNPNPYNRVRHNEDSMGWKFDDSEQADEYIAKQIALRNEYYDFEYSYITSFIDSVITSNKSAENNKKADLLIAHGVNREIIERLCDEHDFFVLNCTMEESQVENNFKDGRYEIALGDSFENITRAIGNIMKYVTYEKGE